MKQSVPEEVLRKYYELWLSGATATRIMKALKLSKVKFNRYTPDFLSYCRHQVKFDTRARMAKGDPPDLIELTQEREDAFLLNVAGGLSYPEAALYMDIPLVTVTDYWFKDTNFKAKVEIATKLINANLTRMAFKRAFGYEYDGGHKTRTSGTKIVERFEGTGKDRVKVTEEIPYHSETVMEKMNVIEPDVAMLKFLMYNRMGDQYAIDGKRTGRDNKGKILQWIEEQVGGLDDKEMGDFDQEQEQYDNKHNR